jgi:hypothetical protein
MPAKDDARMEPPDGCRPDPWPRRSFGWVLGAFATLDGLLDAMPWLTLL